MRTSKIMHRAGVAAVVVWSLGPIYWALNTSLQTNVQATAPMSSYLPLPPYWHNYAQLFGISNDTAAASLPADIANSAFHSLIECGAATCVTVVLALFAAYAFARMRFRFRGVLLYALLATMALPAYATLIPLYKMMAAVHLVDTYLGIVLVYVSGFLPLAVWILYNYIVSIPVSLEEAANVDGAGWLKTIWYITLPAPRPGITATAIITFLFAWSQFLFPLVLATDSSHEPLTVFMNALLGQQRGTVSYTLVNAAAVLVIAVPAPATLLMSRYIVNGLTAGAVK
jgi:multiple sugar transport system permease protein